jgi:hypothetical protein
MRLRWWEWWEQTTPIVLLQYFGHLAIKADSVVYVTRRVPVEVMSRSQKNYTEEIPVVYNRTKIFVDPISSVIMSDGPQSTAMTWPPSVNVGGKWCCSSPELREYHDPALLPVDEVQLSHCG